MDGGMVKEAEEGLDGESSQGCKWREQRKRKRGWMERVVKDTNGGEMRRQMEVDGTDEENGDEYDR